jgi:hypothetical protein
MAQLERASGYNYRPPSEFNSLHVPWNIGLNPCDVDLLR